jgi:hypothetical protein
MVDDEVTILPAETMTSADLMMMARKHFEAVYPEVQRVHELFLKADATAKQERTHALETTRETLPDGDRAKYCADCYAIFVLTAAEQAWYAEAKMHPPKRCKLCRAARRETRHRRTEASPIDLVEHQGAAAK